MTHVNDITITVADRQRLGTLVDNAATKWTIDQKLINDLEVELERAERSILTRFRATSSR